MASKNVVLTECAEQAGNDQTSQNPAYQPTSEPISKPFSSPNSLPSVIPAALPSLKTIFRHLRPDACDKIVNLAALQPADLHDDLDVKLHLLP